MIPRETVQRCGSVTGLETDRCNSQEALNLTLGAYGSCSSERGAGRVGEARLKHLASWGERALGPAIVEVVPTYGAGGPTHGGAWAAT